VEPDDEGETEMTSAVATNADGIRELTVDELDAAGGGLVMLAACFLGGLAVGAALGYYLFVAP